MSLAGKRVAVLVENLYQEMEVWYPILRLREEGAEVITVSTQAGQTYTSKLGYPVKADMAFDAVTAAEFHGVVVPGGFAPDYIRRHQQALSFVREVHGQNKLVASICHGPWVLCSAGVLKGKRATSFFAIKDDVTNAGALWEDVEVVVDGNLVTSRKPEDLPAFCRASIQVLNR